MLMKRERQFTVFYSFIFNFMGNNISQSKFKAFK